MLSIFDQKHSNEEDRWITIGLSESGRLLVVVHTFDDSNVKSAVIRIVSARKATKKETAQYKGKV